MKRPNFFIIGSPKCGTTSLASWLRAHPSVFIPDLKEPHFFNSDSGHRLFKDLARYEGLFESATTAHEAVGEASVWYLVSQVAVQNILTYNPASRFIVCVRNPIEMAVSLHAQKRFSGDENIREFEEAWDKQWPRLAGDLALPRTCVDINHLMYGPSCEHGRLITQLLSVADRDSVKIVLVDDMKQDPRQLYLSVLDFLSVEDDGRVEFWAENTAKVRKSPLVQSVVRNAKLWKQRKGYDWSLGLVARIQAWNTRRQAREPVPDEVIDRLRDYFRDDIRVCEELLGRDLGHWLE